MSCFSPYFATSAFLIVFLDLIPRGFVLHVMVLSAIHHICPSTSPLNLLVWGLALLNYIKACLHLCPYYIWVGHPVMFSSVCICEYVLQTPSSFCNLLSEILLCHYQCLVDVSYVACDKSACLCYPHYVQLSIVICTVALCNHSVYQWSTILYCTATIDPTG